MNKVLLEFNSVDFGSTGNVAKSIVSFANQNGVKAFMFCGQHKKEKNTTYSIADNSSHFYLSFESRIKQPLLGYGFNCKTATKKMLDYFQKNCVKSGDRVVIHLHNIHGSFAYLPEIADFVKKHNYGLAITLHDCWYFTGGCAYFDISGCNKWENEDCKNCGCDDEYPLYKKCANETFLEKKAIFDSLDKEKVVIITPSFWLSSLAKKSILGRFQIATNHHGINLSKWQNFHGINNDKTTINVVSLASPWTKRKGLDDVNYCADNAPSNFHFTVIGLKDSDVTSPKIERKGHIPDDEVISTMANADILLNPTYEDNFPATNIEGLSLGLFIITYLTGGSPEAADDKTGLAVAKGDKVALLKAITDFKPTAEQKKLSMQRSALFSLDNQNKEYLSIISKLFDR